MNLVTLAFYFFAVLTLAFAAVVVFSRNILHAAFALLFTFFGVASMYVLLQADFLAISQIMIYIGGILILIIFGVILTTNITGVEVKSDKTGRLQLVSAGIATLLLAATLIGVMTTTQWNTAEVPAVDATAEAIGTGMLTRYLLAFETASMLLLIAIVGAAFIARKKPV
ncbi:MAG: NADH-quinone oxidoreductase subunit J [Bacteroidales bacterium]|nr:NADH-quinone oxidoreductase subunit J [Bacteroidales bacterium]